MLISTYQLIRLSFPFFNYQDIKAWKKWFHIRNKQVWLMVLIGTGNISSFLDSVHKIVNKWTEMMNTKGLTYYMKAFLILKLT